ncbi:MAG: hypothetical protein E7317_02840 [Clostridiales bacterium]|nr:hypothetical protein [Clostridiales bacterium]
MNDTPAYTARLTKSLDEISWEDDDFIEELRQTAQLFRPFSQAMDAFLVERGYQGDISDAGEKALFIRAAFADAGMEAPREVRKWFDGQPVRRETVFQICFAFGLDGDGTDDFFRRFYTRERSFNCHLVEEAVYYFCLNNGLTWTDARDLLRDAPQPGAGDGEVVYTGSIIAALNGLSTKEEMAAWLRANIGKFVGSNVTACESIRRLWGIVAGPDGLLLREREALPSLLNDAATGRKSALRAGQEGLKPWDACLAIFQLDKGSVKRLETDRSLKPMLAHLHDAARDSFPDRQGIDKILRGDKVSYERVRKWLVLLTFYAFWARRAVERGSYAADPGDAARCMAETDRFLVDAGYPELYVGNPYDWIFFYAARDEEPLFLFRYIFNELLAGTLEAHP